MSGAANASRGSLYAVYFYLEKLGFAFRDGRAPEAPELAKGAAAKRIAAMVLGEAVVPMDHRQPGVHRKVAAG